MLINPPFCNLPAIYPQIAFFGMEKATNKYQARWLGQGLTSTKFGVKNLFLMKKQIFKVVICIRNLFLQ